MKIVLMIFAVAVIAMGALWTGQGAGLVSWPQESFMIGDRQWTWWGVVLVVAGFILFYRALRR
jgi:hypothetical protein